MTQSLFFEPQVTFEKVAAEATMPEDPNTWPQEITQELFKQAPYASDFENHIVMDRVDAERAFAFGHIEISSKTEIQRGAEPDATLAAGIKNARIPIVIKDRKLQPLDLVVTEDSSILPLTESRLRQAIFRPQAFDITGRGPGDMSMIGQLYPPYRQNYGFGGGGATMSTGMGKESSAKEAMGRQLGEIAKKVTDPATAARLQGAVTRTASKLTAAGNPVGPKYQQVATYLGKKVHASVLPAILATINASDYNCFFHKVASDPGLQAQLVHNGPATEEVLRLLASYEPTSPMKLATAVLEHLKPTVVQLRKEAEGYSLKTASHNCWLPQRQELDRGEALRLLGEKVVLAADTTGSATMTLGEGVQESAPPAAGAPAASPTESPEEDVPEPVTQFGIYKVQDQSGKHIIGYVFTNLIDLDGTALPISLFTNGSEYAMQGDIVGVNVGGGASLFEGRPQGLGVFYHLLSNGRAEATIPMTVHATMSSPEQGGVTLQAETFDGRSTEVHVQPGIEKLIATGESLAVPDTYCWLPLEGSQETHLVGNPEEFNKEGEARHALSSVTVRCGGGVFSLDGLPVEKLANEEKNFLNLDDTVFLLGALGTDVDYAQQKLGQAAAWSAPVQVRVGRYIKLASDRMNQAKQAAADFLQYIPALRVDLVKEAAVIPDPMAVDTVLSLGFLNPENLGIFVSYLPTLDEAQKKMCELLLASRLGLRDVPAGALEKAIKAMENSIEGLKILSFQGTD